MKQLLLMIVIVAVALGGCSKKNPPKPEDLSHLSIPRPPLDWTDEPPQLDTWADSGPGGRGAGREGEDDWSPERKAEAMRRYKSELAEWERKQAEQKRKDDVDNRKLHDYRLAMEEWYNSLVVCLHCGSDLAAKGAKVCPECLREQRE